MSTLYPLKSLKYFLFVQSELLSAVTGFGTGARKAQLFIEMAVPFVCRRGLEPPSGLRVPPEQLPQGLLSDALPLMACRHKGALQPEAGLQLQTGRAADEAPADAHLLREREHPVEILWILQRQALIF